MPLLCVKELKIASKMSVCAHVWETQGNTHMHMKSDQKRNVEGLGNKEVSDAVDDLVPAQGVCMLQLAPVWLILQCL
jgi:hypothetical protein